MNVSYNTLGYGAAVALLAIGVACGGSGGGGGSTPTPTSPTPGTGGAAETATITISGAGVSVSSVTIRAGGRVTITNNDTVSHDMSSDPHPTHETCPEMNQIGFLTPGQTKTSGNFGTVRTCGFHDHNLPSNASLQGRIVIVAQ